MNFSRHREGGLDRSAGAGWVKLYFVSLCPTVGTSTLPLSIEADLECLIIGIVIANIWCWGVGVYSMMLCIVGILLILIARTILILTAIIVTRRIIYLAIIELFCCLLLLMLLMLFQLLILVLRRCILLRFILDVRIIPINIEVLQITQIVQVEIKVHSLDLLF